MLRRWGSVVGLLLVAVAVGAAEIGWTSFQFEAYNQEYVNLRSNASWKQGGPIKVRLSSPEHRLVIRDHTLELLPEGDGLFQTRIRVSFSGEGDLIADFGVVGADKRVEDRVVAPLQEVEVDARVRFERADGGYDVQTVELPESVEVEIESRLGQQMVDACRSALAILGAKCGGLDSMFSNVAVPLPPAGETYFLSEDELSRTERRRLNRFLERNS